MTIDLVILSIVMTPIINFLCQYILIGFFYDFFISNGIDLKNMDAFYAAIKTQEFFEQMSRGRFIGYLIVSFMLNVTFMGIYFIFFWYRFNATPGKILLRMKVVDASTFSRPTIYQLIKRFFGYATALIGVWSIIFSTERMALHDKIAHTVVIKS